MQEYKYDAVSDVNWFVDSDYDDMNRLTDTWLYDYNDTTVVKHRASEYWGSGKKKYEDIYGFGYILEKQTDYYYDIIGRLTNVVVAPNDLALTTTYNYDAAGNRTSIIDPNGSIIYFDYNNANRKVAEYFATEPGTDLNIKKKLPHYQNNLVKDVNSYDYEHTKGQSGLGR